MLTSLEPPSPSSSAGPREVERSLQTISQLPGPLPMISPPEPETHRGAAESSRIRPLFKRLQTRFRKTNKNGASQLEPLDQLSTKSGQPFNTFNSRSQPTASIAKKGPSLMAATQRVRVSVFFFVDKRCVVRLTKHLSEWSQYASIRFVVHWQLVR